MCAFYPDLPGGIDINLVGGQQFVLEYRGIRLLLCWVNTTWGSFYSEQEFLILDQDGRIWLSALFGLIRWWPLNRDITKIVDIRGFGKPEEVPIEFNRNVAPEDELLENLDLDAYRSQVSEPWEMCIFNLEFP